MLSSSISSTCPHNMVNFGPLAAEIVSLVWGTPGNSNGFRVFSTLLQRRRSTEINQTLHYVWPSPGLVRYIYTFGISCPLTEFCHVQNSICVHLCTIAQVSGAISSQLRVSRLGSVTARHSSSGRSQTAAFNRGRHLYSLGRPSRWALAHILVLSYGRPM